MRVFNECLHSHGMGAYHGLFFAFDGTRLSKRGIRLCWGAYGNKEHWYHLGITHYPNATHFEVGHGAISYIHNTL